jgi:hypothetical protein
MKGMVNVIYTLIICINYNRQKSGDIRENEVESIGI